MNSRSLLLGAPDELKSLHAGAILADQSLICFIDDKRSRIAAAYWSGDGGESAWCWEIDQEPKYLEGRTMDDWNLSQWTRFQDPWKLLPEGCLIPAVREGLRVRGVPTFVVDRAISLMKFSPALSLAAQSDDAAG